MVDGGLVSIGPNKPFQILKHHNLLSALRLDLCQPVKDPNSNAYGAAYWELVQSYAIIIIEYLRSYEVQASSGKFPSLFPNGEVFVIACLNDQIITVLLFAIRRYSGYM